MYVRIRQPLQLLLVSALMCLVLVLVLRALPAPAATKATVVVKAAQNADLGKSIVVDGKGRTVYILRPETRKKLLCTTSACLRAWPMVTARSSKTRIAKGKGVTGKLSLLKRGQRYQVLLGGKPLYLFASDTTGKATGEGLKSFGGTWLTLSASGGSSTPPPTTTGPSTDPY